MLEIVLSIEEKKALELKSAENSVYFREYPSFSIHLIGIWPIILLTVFFMSEHQWIWMFFSLCHGKSLQCRQKLIVDGYNKSRIYYFVPNWIYSLSNCIFQPISIWPKSAALLDIFIYIVVYFIRHLQVDDWNIILLHFSS